MNLLDNFKNFVDNSIEQNEQLLKQIDDMSPKILEIIAVAEYARNNHISLTNYQSGSIELIYHWNSSFNTNYQSGRIELIYPNQNSIKMGINYDCTLEIYDGSNGKLDVHFSSKDVVKQNLALKEFIKNFNKFYKFFYLQIDEYINANNKFPNPKKRDDYEER